MSATASDSQRQPATASDSQRQPATASHSQRQRHVSLLALATLGDMTQIGSFLFFVPPPATRQASLHYSNYRSKLMHFEAQKLFSMLIKP